MPPKKRRLRIFHNLSSEWNETPGTLLSQALREAEPLYVSSPAPLEQPVQIVLADSVNNLQPHQEEATTNNEQPFSTEDSLLRIKTSTTPSGTEPPYVNSTVTLATNSADISQRRPIDPRLGNSCPVTSSGVNPALSPGGGWPVATSAVPALAVTGQPVLSYSQNNDSSGTPGKKKVRYYCYYCCCCNYYYYYHYHYHYHYDSLKHSHCLLPTDPFFVLTSFNFLYTSLLLTNKVTLWAVSADRILTPRFFFWYSGAPPSQSRLSWMRI